MHQPGVLPGADSRGPFLAVGEDAVAPLNYLGGKGVPSVAPVPLVASAPAAVVGTGVPGTPGEERVVQGEGGPW
jgi:hypothetical protein